jgi:carbon storage regulator
MLVLSRKAGEKIIINGSIEVSIVSVDRGKVRLGISAPPDVSIHRKEVFDRIAEFAEPRSATNIENVVSHSVNS